MMGYWENTAYINTPSVDDVVNELSSMFEKEGMVCISVPQIRKRMEYEPMQYDTALNNNIWGVAVFPGRESWSVIKTAPLELLGEKARDKSYMRFVALCKNLNVPGFMYNIYDSGPEILIESNAAGDYKITGCAYDNPLEYYGERLDESRIEIEFTNYECQAIINGSSDGEDRAMALAREFGGMNSKYCDNITSVESLICHKEVNAIGGKVQYFMWPKEDRTRYPSSSWDEWKRRMDECGL